MTRGAGRAPARLRYGRATALVSSLGVVLVSVLGGAGVLETAAPATYAVVADASAGGEPDREERREDALVLSSGPHRSQPPPTTAPDPAAVPPDSGSGRRVVFDISDQRVWLVRGGRKVARTYLVSGSLTDNLQPGTYRVYSRSRHAIGVDDSGTMEFMVRFATGERAPIGFHSIPVLDGRLVQSRAELGTPQSHGCVRQWRPDAKAMWAFASLGTSVVVTA